MIREKLEWDYEISLEEGIRRTYDWVSEQVYNSQLNEKQLLHDQTLEAV